jgi:hypothetical protein
MDPILVHLPRSWRKLQKLIEHGERKNEKAEGDSRFTPRFIPRCQSHVKAELPEGVLLRRTSDGEWYLIAGPDPRYYRLCGDCADLAG